MCPDIVFWKDLYEKFPETFEIVKIYGKDVLRIIPSKFKEVHLKIKQYIKSKRISSKEQVLHSSEIKKYLVLKEINFDEKNKLIKKYMKSEDWSIYLLGRKALIEKQNYNMSEVIRIKDETRQLAGRRGIRLINFILQGYFEEIFIPLLKHQIGVLKSDSEVISWFNKFLDEQILFFPRAIWVMTKTAEVEIIRGMYKRCVTHDFKEINIHTIGDYNSKKVENVIEELSNKDNFPDFDFDRTEELPNSKLYTFKIKIKE